ncbi:atzF [Scenedesmus sp. PABB004]|nr:atzF [Scenedesmus sp. PABB004]
MSAMLQLAVAGAHLTGLPLNHQLTELGARLVRTVRTAPVYKMYSLGPKPALIRQAPGSAGGGSIELEVWELPIEKVGYFLRDGVKEPLGIGDVLLEDESTVKGFIGEAYAVAGAPDITSHGGWRAYLAAKQ